MSDKFYTTTEASEKTGINQSTIRSWLTRHSELFEIDVHVVIDEHGRKLWTNEGINQLLARKDSPTGDSMEDAQAGKESEEEYQTVLEKQGDSTQEFESLMLEKLLDAAAEKMAIAFFERLPSRTLKRIQRMLANPTTEESELINSSINTAVNSGTSYFLVQNPSARRLPE